MDSDKLGVNVKSVINSSIYVVVVEYIWSQDC